MIDENPFSEELAAAARRLEEEQRRDRFRRLITLGLWNNQRGLAVAEPEYRACSDAAEQYRSLAARAESLDAAAADGLQQLSNARYSTSSTVDLPTYAGSTYGHDWELLRQQILERDGFACQEADGRCHGPLQAHHRIPLSKRGTNHPDNLITLCLFHHEQKHPHMRR